MGINISKLKTLKENMGKGKSEYWKPEDGKNVVRVLPAVEGDEFYKEVYTHYNVGADEKSVICGKTEERDCPICKEIEKLKKGSKTDKELADSMRCKKAYYIQVITPDDPDTPKLYPAPQTVFKNILDIILDPDYGDITDIEEGREITIERTGKGLKTKYTVLPKPKISSLDNWEELKENMVNFADWDYAKCKSDEEMMAIYNSEDLDEEEDFEEDDEEISDDKDYDNMSLSELKEECKSRGIKLPEKVTSIRLIALLEEDDLEEENGEEEEEIEEKPRKKGGKK